MWTCFIFWPMKNFPKTISQSEFDFGLFTNLLIIIFARDFCPSSLKLKSYPTCLDKVCIVKTTCHIKLKFFLWTKLLGNLLLGKYLVSVAVPLTLISVPDGYIPGVAYEIYHAKYYFWVLLMVRLLIGHSIFDKKRRKLQIFLKNIK